MSIFDDTTTEEQKVESNVTSLRKPYAIWTVNGIDYKLKLTTSAIIELENKLRGNLINVLDMGVPPLETMLGIVHGAIKKFHHGTTFEKVKVLFDDYCDEGGSQVAFLTDVILPLFEVSGFFSPKQAEKMTEGLDEAKEQL